MLTLSVSEAYEVYRNNPLSVYTWTLNEETGELEVQLLDPHTEIMGKDVSALSPEDFASLYGTVIFLSAAEASANRPPEEPKDEEEPAEESDPEAN